LGKFVNWMEFSRLLRQLPISSCGGGFLEDIFLKSKWPISQLVALVKRKNCDSKVIIMLVFLGVTNAQCCNKVNQIGN
jgi:hypothetical protein